MTTVRGRGIPDEPRAGGPPERCAACKALGQRHRVRRLYAVGHRHFCGEGGVVPEAIWRYACSNGHEWTGDRWRRGGPDERDD